jgi:hypothetical protein
MASSRTLFRHIFVAIFRKPRIGSCCHDKRVEVPPDINASVGQLVEGFYANAKNVIGAALSRNKAS